MMHSEELSAFLWSEISQEIGCIEADCQQICGVGFKVELVPVIHPQKSLDWLGLASSSTRNTMKYDMF